MLRASRFTLSLTIQNDHATYNSSLHWAIKQTIQTVRCSRRRFRRHRHVHLSIYIELIS